MNSSSSQRLGVAVMQRGVSRNIEATAALEALLLFRSSPNAVNHAFESSKELALASSQISSLRFRSPNHLQLTMGEMEWSRPGSSTIERSSFSSGSRRHFHFLRLLSSLNSPEKQNPKKVVPDAEQCDSALEDYQQLKNRLDNIKKPSALRPWNPIDLLKVTGNIIVATGKFTLAIPGWTRDFMNMPKDEWAKKKTEMWKTVKHEAHHYWVGTKLLGYEIKISARLAMKVATGKELLRRERQQLLRTVADLFRLVPMIVILIVPLAEFALPLLLRIFPNMLPSTYEDKLKKEEELKRRLGIKLELARFLQDTVAEVAKDISRRKGSGSGAEELSEFIDKVRAGVPVENSDILRFAQLFNDDLTLDNLERVQLVSICSFVGLAPYGTDAYLKTRLRQHVLQLKKDDYEIENEGLESLTEEELRVACRARGMRAPFGEAATDFMRRQMHDWLDLSLHRGLPSSLLLLSRAFTITANIKDVAEKKNLAYEKLKETLSVIPEEIVDQVAAPKNTVEELEKKIEVLKREEALIQAELEKAKVKKPLSSVKSKLQEAMKASTASSPIPLDLNEEDREVAEAERRQHLKNLAQALMDLVSGSGVATERTKFLELVKNETERLRGDLGKSAMQSGQQTSQLIFSREGASRGQEFGSEGEVAKGAAPADKDLAPLSERVGAMLQSIEKELDTVEMSIGKKMSFLDTDGDGVISQQELEQAVSYLKTNLGSEELKELYSELAALSAEQEDPSLGIKVERLANLAAQAPSDKKHK